MGWTRTDDLGGPGEAMPTTFGLDGCAYVVDLNADNARRLWDALEPFVAKATKYADLALPPVPAAAASSNAGAENVTDIAVPSEPGFLRKQAPTKVKSRGARSSRSAAAVTERETIRRWASENGFEVAERGRISNTILDAFAAAHPA